MRSNKPLRFVVIGGGMAGIEAANKISEFFPKAQIFLLEQYILLSGSSGRTPGRMGHGFHYVNETAFQVLESSITFQKKYPSFLIGHDKPFSHPIRHGRYYITKTSNKSYEEVLKFYLKLQQHYAKLVADDPSNQVFGPPESFFRVLEPSEYQDCVNVNEVVGGIETNEHLFDFQRFASNMREYFTSHPHIILKESTEVVNLERIYDYDTHEYFYNIHTKSTKDASAQLFSADFIINSTWQNIEYINSKLGIPFKERTNRLKAVVRIRLPSEAYSLNSSFFCMGPFCMFSNLGNGEGLITCAETTNLATSNLLKISQDMEDFIHGKASKHQRLNIARLILEGVKKYLPLLKSATIIDIRFGIVQTQGFVDIQSLSLPTAPHHFRNYLGVREEIQGLISNPAVKLFNAVENGNEVLRLIQLQLDRSNFNHMLIDQLFSKYDELTEFDSLREIILEHFDRMLLPLTLTIDQQQKLIDQLYQLIQSTGHIQLSEIILSFVDDKLLSSKKRRFSIDDSKSTSGEETTDSDTELTGRSFEDKHQLLSLTDKEVSKSLETFEVFRPLNADVKEKILAIKLIPMIGEDKELERQKQIKREMALTENYNGRPGSAIGFFKSAPLETNSQMPFRSLSTDEMSHFSDFSSRKIFYGK